MITRIVIYVGGFPARTNPTPAHFELVSRSYTVPVTTNTFNLLPGDIAFPHFAEVVMAGTVPESDGGLKPFVNIFHFARESGPGTGTEAQFAVALQLAWAAAWAACIANQFTGTTMSVRFMDDPLRAAVVGPNAIIGLSGGDRLPTYNAMVIQKKTYARGRSFMGSNHYGPISDSDQQLDNLTVGAQATCNAFRAILQAMGGGGAGFATPDGSLWRLCVFSATLSDYTVSPIQVTGSKVQTCLLNIRLGTMKRRKDRTGPST